MPFNGSGTYSAPALPGSWNPAQSGSTASPTDWNTLLADLSSALSTAICRDGQSTVTAAIPFNSQRITGLGDATADTDALNRRGAWWVFDQQSVSAQAQIDFVDIPATVSNIMLVLELAPSVNGADIRLRTAPASGTFDTGASDYNYLLSTLGATSATPSPAGVFLTTSFILLGTGVSNGAGGLQATMTMAGIQNTARQKKFNIQSTYVNTSSVNINAVGSGWRNAASVITAVRIYPSSGTITGTATLYASV
jgi:hypothetical protein